MALNIDGSKIGAVQYNGLTIGEAMMDGKIVYRSTHPLIKSKPDYWYSMENGAHWLNRGTKNPIMHHPTGVFGDRGDHAYTNGVIGRVEVTEAWADSFTVAGWYDIRARDSTAYLFSRAMIGNRRECLYVISTSSEHQFSTNSVGLRILSNAETSDWGYAPPNIIPDAEWFHIAVVVDHPAGSRNRLKLYINGVFVFEVSFPEQPKLNIPAGTPASFGAFVDPTTASRAVYANVDDLAMWNRALSDDEVSSIHNAGPVPTAMLTPPPPYQSESFVYSNPGYALIDIPSWVTEIDYIAIGGGGGGDRGDSALNREGISGKAGIYAVGTFHPNENQIGLLVGAGGSGTTGAEFNPTNGGASAIFNQAGTAIIAEAAGGEAKAHIRGNGESPGNASYKTIYFGGGTGGSTNSAGSPPGGGGGGGSGGIFGSFQRGMRGGRGEVFLLMKNRPT